MHVLCTRKAKHLLRAYSPTELVNPIWDKDGTRSNTRTYTHTFTDER